MEAAFSSVASGSSPGPACPYSPQPCGPGPWGQPVCCFLPQTRLLSWVLGRAGRGYGGLGFPWGLPWSEDGRAFLGLSIELLSHRWRLCREESIRAHPLLP